MFKAHRLCVSLNSRLESNKEEREEDREGPTPQNTTGHVPPHITCPPIINFQTLSSDRKETLVYLFRRDVTTLLTFGVFPGP